ncbi:MAG: hypothetical protein ABSG51_02400 [Terracidiphilus sp.]|jgi:hypothetical protein
MTEAYENVLRKSLDIADRRQKLGKASKLALFLGIGFIVVGELNIVPAIMYMRVMDKYLLFVATFVGAMMFLCGLSALVISISHRNTQTILRAIQLASDAAGMAPAVPESLNKRLG